MDTVRIEAFKTRIDKSKVLRKRGSKVVSYFPAVQSADQKPLESSLLEREIQAYRYNMSNKEEDEDDKEYLDRKYAHLFGLSKTKSKSSPSPN